MGAIDTFQGEVWCTVRDSLFRYNDKTEILDFVYKLNLERITSMLVEDSKLWIGTSHGLYLKEKDDIRCLLPAVEIYRIFRSSRDERVDCFPYAGTYII